MHRLKIKSKLAYIISMKDCYTDLKRLNGYFIPRWNLIQKGILLSKVVRKQTHTQGLCKSWEGTVSLVTYRSS